jgi:hypothetical protein
MPTFGQLAPGNGPQQREKTGKPIVEVEPPSFTSGQRGNPFQAVQNANAQRQGFGGIPAHSPPPAPAASPTQGSSSSPTGDFSAAGNLTSWGGFQMDASLVPYAQGLTGLGLTLSGGYRDPARNAAVNGVPNSWHLSGRALDLSGTTAQMQAGAAWARQHGANEVLIHNAGSGLHLHVAW